MWDDCYEGKSSVLSSAAASNLSSTISNLFTNWFKSFPEQVITSILLRLPIKSLIKFTSVCKSWRSLIKDPTFIRTHLNSNGAQNANPLILLHSVFCRNTEAIFGNTHMVGFKNDLYSLHFDNKAFDHHCNFGFPPELEKIKENPCFRVAACCNGLVCLVDDLGCYAYTFVLWNPSVRRYVTLPKPCVRFCSHGGYEASVGLGYDDVSKDYKVVRLTTLLDQPSGFVTLAQVYSLAKGYWGRLHSELPQCVMLGSMEQACVNGALHWLALKWIGDALNHFVLTFDVGSESFGEMVLPRSFGVSMTMELMLSASGDGKSIALFVTNMSEEADGCVDIWLMKDYGAEKSWTKVMVLGPQGPKRSLPEALCFRRNGKVLLVLGDSRELVSLDIVSKQLKNLGISGGQVCSVDFFEESLVLLDRKDAISY